MNIENRQFIIAYNFLNPEKSIILHPKAIGSEKEVFSKTDANSFVGQGIWICESRIIESIAEAKDYSCEIILGGKSTAFEISKIVQCFPVIEGEISPGIYRFYERQSDCFEIKDALALSKFFDEEPNFDYENEKFVCSSDRIGIYGIKSGEELCSYQRYSLSFFDIYCPFCKQKVMTYEVDSYIFRCESLSLPCSHFVGSAVWSSVGYEVEELNDLKINHKLIGENLYFETSKGWQKPIVYIPPFDPVNSYWGSSLSRDKLIFHFFFIESEPEFWIR